MDLRNLKCSKDLRCLVTKFLILVEWKPARKDKDVLRISPEIKKSKLERKPMIRQYSGVLRIEEDHLFQSLECSGCFHPFKP